MSQAVVSTAGGGAAEVSVRVAGISISVGTDRPTLLPSLLDRLPAGWERLRTLRLSRCYVLWADKAPFRLQIDQNVVLEAANLAVVLEAFAADVAEFTRRG